MMLFEAADSRQPTRENSVPLSVNSPSILRNPFVNGARQLKQQGRPHRDLRLRVGVAESKEENGHGLPVMHLNGNRRAVQMHARPIRINRVTPPTCKNTQRPSHLSSGVVFRKIVSKNAWAAAGPLAWIRLSGVADVVGSEDGVGSEACLPFYCSGTEQDENQFHIFLDLEAQTADHDDEEEDDFEDDWNGFLDRRAFADDIHPRPVVMAIMDDVGPSAQEEADAIRARHRERTERERHRFDGDQDAFQWIHKADSRPSLADADIWRLRVKSGHETDVVCTMTLDLPRSKFHSVVKSITAPATTRGCVYVETNEMAAVSYLQSRVAFVLQHFPPERVPVADYVPLVFSKSPALLSSLSWARVKRKGPYCGRLAWIQHSDPYRCCYELWLVPIVVPSEIFEDPFDLFLRRYYTFDGDIVSFGRTSFIGGLLVQYNAPLYSVVEDAPCPTMQELDQFASNRLFFDGSPPPDGEALFHSIHIPVQRHAVIESMSWQARWPAVSGTVLTADPEKLTVKFSSPIETQEEIARSAVVYKLYPGDLVEIIRGKRQGQKGWIISIDWAVRVASVFDVKLLFLKPTSHDFHLAATSIIGPPAKKKRKVDRTVDRMANIEQQWLLDGDGINGRKGGAGQNQSALRKSHRTTVRRSTLNLTSTNNTGSTALDVREFLRTPVPVRLALRKSRERRRAEALEPALTEDVWHGSMDLGSTSWTHPSVAIDERDRATNQHGTVRPSTESYASDTHGGAPLNAFGPSEPSVSVPAPSAPSSRREKAASDPTRGMDNYGLPGGQFPGHWLTQPSLRGHTLDVVIRNSQRSHGGRYEGKIGTVLIPVVKKISMGNRDNSLEVMIDSSSALSQSFKLWNIFPLTTTEFENRIPTNEVISLFDACGAWVVIIGPDKRGNVEHVGKLGQIVVGGWVLVDDVHYVEVESASICRSDPFPRFKLEAVTIVQDGERARRAAFWGYPAPYDGPRERLMNHLQLDPVNSVQSYPC
ncbi:hypothetical protein C8F04DRAFT_1184051 [Mycena alexandri]|uniref:NGN domain-containing protein n=1 Tax=Mycena alexandri TaxID=1745969 RepID=A0AAD6SV20_9AGAR|nr:hypothetical protein C8F04DRAFT_1184051 [Mycena alexandri]